MPAGTSLAIVGPTGSGKTRLVSLIPRIFDSASKVDRADAARENGYAATPSAEAGHAPASGSLLLDGRPLHEYPLATLRRNIGFVPQETFLFSASVRDNIAFGVPDATDDQVRSPAQAASIAPHTTGLAEKSETSP